MDHKVKILGKGTAVAGTVGAGSGIAALGDSRERIEYSLSKDKNSLQTAVIRGDIESGDKRTIIKKFKNSKLTVEDLYIDGGKRPLYNPVEERETDILYYITNSDNKKILLSLSQPIKENSGIFKGWELHKFTWEGTEDLWGEEYLLKDKDFKVFWGYCSPKDSDLGGKECEKLPSGWKVEKSPYKVISHLRSKK